MTDLPASHRPRPLRTIAAVAALITLIVGGLPTIGVPLSAEAVGWLVGVVGALAAVAVALLGEPLVTPVSSPRDDDGTPLIRAPL
jgi:hypothetical protein